jgi:hypothetical protein
MAHQLPERSGAIKFELADDRLDLESRSRPYAECGRDTILDPEVRRQAGVTSSAIGLPELRDIASGQDNLGPTFVTHEGPLGVWVGFEETGEDGVRGLGGGFAGGKAEVGADQGVSDGINLCHDQDVGGRRRQVNHCEFRATRLDMEHGENHHAIPMLSGASSPDGIGCSIAPMS